jgi:hypothetical protein
MFGRKKAQKLNEAARVAASKRTVRAPADKFRAAADKSPAEKIRDRSNSREERRKSTPSV